MEHSANRIGRAAKWCCLAIAIIGASAAATRVAKTEIMTDSDLYRAAYNALARKDTHLTAAIYLFAYIQRSPADDASRVSRAQETYDALFGEIRDALKQGRDDRAELQRRDQSPGSVSSGLSGGRAIPPLPAPDDRPTPSKPAIATPHRNLVTGASMLMPLDGAWTFAMHSTVSNGNYAGQIQFELASGAVMGTMNIQGQGARAVRGIQGAVGDSIDLVRDTGLETIQHFRLARSGVNLAGRFWNVGKYPDSGNITLHR
jgi:hypothetical protein